ncbi:Cloroperoxidase [Laetiporus sulphureus 93-53]|uniref:Cloroperoxidase n=1 Tax=Laetiporus sulphureus 93-53 TaxID=1314785 RepID=A0A165IMT2_9APHY|nr:Cloroperoxidase [Laetiporus sulphureus 93-53]KZT13297.1 Cloroperoxidase [Laetiporus sulphureus 93-53]
MFSFSVKTKGFSGLLIKYALVTAVIAMIVRLILSVDELARDEIPEFSLKAHPFVPPKSSDSRSPCPALNALANHGFLPHDGRNITRKDYVHALREGYSLSLPLAMLLTYGGHIVLEQYSVLTLSDLARHNFIEHDASLGHYDAIGTEEYAPIKASAQLIRELIAESSDGEVMTMEDFAHARVRREANYRHPLDAIHEEIARGEMSMVLGIFGRGNETVPVRWIEEWWLNSTFPSDWAPTHQQTLLMAVQGSQKLRRLMRDIRAAAKSG